MNNDIVSRIKEFMDYKSMNSLTLANKLGYKSSEKLSRLFRVENAKPSYDIIYDISNMFEINTDWLITGRGSMFCSEPDVNAMPTINQEYKGAPYYNVDFIGGFDLTPNDQTQCPDYYINYYPYNKSGVVWCNVTGHSMEPKINHGDVIALKDCTLNDVQYGEIYAVVLDTIRTVKILRKSQDPNKLRFVPINTKDYDEQEFDKSRVIKLYEVLGSISKFF
ncbi:MULTISPECIES: S24 family peptidase [Bacteroides]|uniref:Peptidase S24/S26A/S26B/S26C domain-containing protein n=1 Tax=Bacteroides ovatus TaxID=28116 RepID=A0A6A1XNR3_BACOV|nr:MULTISPECIES: S24 family peptidase [Bacteroides]KAB1328389.1 hypothetical protein F3B53_07175 [Bacteroides ovatus]KAA5258030.1 hypothetical protein F2Z43_22315 [Bacteroides faecis]KAA5283586.1 hypothetical protein F2Z11_23515 [Bacteroides faecis]KAA5295350.1 hypothetical protein F2Z35_21770 [Bacteroides faecis]MBS5608968.1 hypothetical protein [Bacteroides sp.]